MITNNDFTLAYVMKCIAGATIAGVASYLIGNSIWSYAANTLF